MPIEVIVRFNIREALRRQPKTFAYFRKDIMVPRMRVHKSLEFSPIARNDSFDLDRNIGKCSAIHF
jgi:hypothetical protein